MDLEEGEVTSSDNEGEEPFKPPPAPTNSLEFPDFPDDTDYVILDRPKSSLPTPSSSSNRRDPVLQSPMSGGTTVSSATPVNSNVMPFGNATAANNTSGFSTSFAESPIDDYYGGRKEYYKNLGVSDLLESQSSEKESSDEDSDDSYKGMFGKRSRKTNPSSSSNRVYVPGPDTSSYPALFSSEIGNQPSIASGSNTNMSNNNAPTLSGLSLSAFQAAASNFQKQRKPNTVWSSVIQEEQISTFFEQGVKVEDPSLTNIEVERGPETYFFQRPMREPRQRRESDSSDISSEGLSDNALHYLRDGANLNEDENETEESSDLSLPKSFTGRSTSRKTTGVKRRRSNSKLKRKVFNRLRNKKSSDLAQYIADKLSEEKVNLICRAIEILGKEKCIHLFIKTLKIERRGGLMIRNQTRRRTPGGVFLYLMRGDRRVPKSQIDLIFRDDKISHDKFRKKKLAVGRLNRKAKLEAQKAEFELAEATMKDDSYSDDTAATWQDPDGTDTGQLGDDSTQESSVHENNGSNEMHCDGSES